MAGISRFRDDEDGLVLVFPGARPAVIQGRAAAVAIPARRWALAWGPLVQRVDHEPAAPCAVLRVAAIEALSWPEARPLLARLMTGAVALLAGEAADGPAAARWSRDLGDAARRPLALLQIQARARRHLARRSQGLARLRLLDAREGRALCAMLDALEGRGGAPPRLAEVARAAGMKPDTASRFFHRLVALSVRDYGAAVRMARARLLLGDARLPIRAVAARCGFNSLARFYAAFVRAEGKAPAAFRARALLDAGAGLRPLEINRQRDPRLPGHVHPHLELNYLFSGAMRYAFAGRAVTVPAGRWALLWAPLPHALTSCEPRTDTLALAIPVALASAWAGTAALLKHLMAGRVLMLAPRPDDRPLAERWTIDGSDPALRPAVLLEIEALARRAALELGGAGGAGVPPPRDARAAGVGFGEMIAFLHDHVESMPPMRRAAAAGGLAPEVAGRLFRRYLGCGVRGYQSRLRMAAAHRLLEETDEGMLEIALRCGFQSISRFHAAFKRVFGATPGAVRGRRPRRGLGPGDRAGRA